MRLHGIDFARGLAVVGMVIFNYAFALQYFGLFSFDSYLFWTVFPRLVAGAFIFIAGVSMAISYSKSREYGKHVKRGAVLFSLGALITAATMIFTDAPVLFGVLHMIGASTIICFVFLRYFHNKLILPIGLAVVVMGVILSANPQHFSPFFWLFPAYFQTLDYFPLLPWMGVMMIGVYTGGRFYAGSKKSRQISKPIELMGRHSLAIYLVHIPLLVGALYAAGITVF